jgi:hypothetical protein
MHKHSTLYFKTKETFLSLTSAHLALSLSLIICAQYTESLLFQFLYLLLIVRYKNQTTNALISFLYLLFVHHALVQFFISDYVLLYFANLIFLSYLLYRADLGIRRGDALACGIFSATLLTLWSISDAFRYSFYVWLDVVDVQNDAALVVVYALALLHLSLLIFIEFKKN